MKSFFKRRKLNIKHMNNTNSFLIRNKSETMNYYTKNSINSTKILKGKLFKIFNSSLLMTDEKFKEFEHKIHYEKYINDEKKKNKNRTNNK